MKTHGSSRKRCITLHNKLDGLFSPRFSISPILFFVIHRVCDLHSLVTQRRGLMSRITYDTGITAGVHSTFPDREYHHNMCPRDSRLRRFHEHTFSIPHAFSTHKECFDSWVRTGREERNE